jgi:hypothetical protein
MAGAEQLGDDSGAEVSGCAGDENSHGIASWLLTDIQATSED